MTLATTTINSAALPYSKTIQIGSVILDSYYDPNTEEYFFSGRQLSRQLEDKSNDGVADFLKSKRAETLTNQGLGLYLEVAEKTKEAIDSQGNVKQVIPVSIVQAGLYIQDLIRKNPKNKTVWIVSSLLVVDSLQKRVHEAHGQVHTPQQLQQSEQRLYKILNQRQDCDIALECDCDNLVTAAELAEYLGYEINRTNSNRLAFYLLRNTHSELIIGRRLYDLSDHQALEVVNKFFQNEALHRIEFDKECCPNPFDCPLVDNFSDL